MVSGAALGGALEIVEISLELLLEMSGYEPTERAQEAGKEAHLGHGARHYASERRRYREPIDWLAPA